MSYGIIEYDDEGKPICEICRLSFHRVLSHVRQKHGINEEEYKLKFGLDLIKGICSKESSEKSRLKVLANYDRCIKRNLLEKGAKTKFSKGDPGRTIDMISPQTMIAMIKRLKSPTFKMIQARIESGKKLGKSQLGNKKRWNK